MIRTQWFSILFFSNVIFLSVNAQEVAPKPSAIFKAVFWDRFTSKNLSYAPWGNYEDNNATMVSLQVGFSTVSRPFVYYGSPPVKFFEKTYQTETSIDSSPSDNEKKELGDFSFEKTEGQTQHFLLLFLKQSNNQKFKIFPLPLSYKDLELGSFKSYSQCKENLYLAYGDQKQVLAPGKSVMFRCQISEDLEKSKLRVFTRNGSKYEEVVTDYLTLNRDMRAYVFLSPYRNRIRIKRYFVDKIEEKNSLGFGMSPLKVQVQQNTDQNSSSNSLQPFTE
tara:strand:+ start:2284 stop:3117 length:834 start_codon:yes stop_codon:yes gene_type:complete